jgi:hypothetical protein
VRVRAGDACRAADAEDDAADEVPVQRAAVVGDQALAAADVLEVGRGPGSEQLDQLGVQQDVAVVAELAQRDPQPVHGADLDDRVGLQAGQLAGPHRYGPAARRPAGRGGRSVLALAAAISRAASRSPGNLGSGSGFVGMSPAMTGLRRGASGQSHSMIRSKNWRTVRIRCRCVSLVIVRPPARGWTASHTL